MTEGIIQKWGNRFNIPNAELQELIAEIKKKYGESQHGVFIIKLEELIGDNE